MFLRLRLSLTDIDRHTDRQTDRRTTKWSYKGNFFLKRYVTLKKNKKITNLLLFCFFAFLTSGIERDFSKSLSGERKEGRVTAGDTDGCTKRNSRAYWLQNNNFTNSFHLQLISGRPRLIERTVSVNHTFVKIHLFVERIYFFQGLFKVSYLQ